MDPHGPDEPLDRETLDRLRRLGGEAEPALVADLVRSFLAQLPGLLDAVRQALASGDARGAERAAHRLKGMSGALGALSLSAAAAALEDVARGGTLAAAPERLARLEEEAARAGEALRREASGGPP